jgi:hypothetical protein
LMWLFPPLPYPAANASPAYVFDESERSVSSVGA